MDVLLALAVAAVLVPFVQDLTAQPASRLALTAALWERHAVRVDGYPLGIDRATYKGHLYSDKSPGQPVLAVPAYGVARALGAESDRHKRIHGNLMLWAVTVFSAMLPAAILAVLMRRVAGRVDRRYAVAASLAIALGTLLLVFGTLLYGHVFAGALIFGSYAVVTGRSRLSALRLASAGLMCGIATATEYPVILLAALVGIVALTRAGRRVWPFVAAAVMPLLGLLAYQAAVFGSPFTATYKHSADPIQRHGVAGVGVPSIRMLGRVLFGDRGLLLFTPVVAIGLVGIWLLLRDRDASLKREGLVGLGAMAALLLVQSGWSNPWGGEMPGPRFVIPALPFLAAPLARVLRTPQGRLATAVAAGVGFATMGLATFAGHLAPLGASPINYWVSMLRHGHWIPTVFTMMLGRPGGWVVQAVLVVGLLAALARAAVREA